MAEPVETVEHTDVGEGLNLLAEKRATERLSDPPIAYEFVEGVLPDCCPKCGLPLYGRCYENLPGGPTYFDCRECHLTWEAPTEFYKCICCGNSTAERGECGCWMCYVCIGREHDDDEAHADHAISEYSESAERDRA